MAQSAMAQNHSSHDPAIEVVAPPPHASMNQQQNLIVGQPHRALPSSYSLTAPRPVLLRKAPRSAQPCTLTNPLSCPCRHTPCNGI
ncbi:hypothetical protein L3X38_003418 [Prunus dulcis]|uniref:Uncharacterized protein n=1 Tax=Prunus dulcis TaxID=3755 RepID=A0AAD4ZLZ7_PRUDU|nr:hypothetical protein L3X38_003418 [Prunus dulcis]